MIPERINEVEQVLATLRPAMEADGGGVELVAVRGNVVEVQLKGTCMFCPSLTLTLKRGIEPALKSALPWVSGVVNIDEVRGSNGDQ